jgi:dihydroneopterin aldolase
MHKLEKLILESYAQIDEETLKPKDLPAAFKAAIEKRHGPLHPHDFFTQDMTRYMKFDGENKVSGQISHKVIAIPSFDKMYTDYSDIVQDIKVLMRDKDVRTDKAARELFELIRTNFRKLQRYLRIERPDQYALIRSRATLESLHESFQIHASLIIESMLDEVEDEEPTPEEEPDTTAGEETVLEDATDKILGRFPTVKAAIVKLQTEQFKEFVDSIDWISPRPSSFRVNLKNGQDYILKWTGKTFEAQILGKKYILSNIAEYQQALDKLAILYKEAPMTGAGDGEPADTDTGGGGGGGGEFPGEEGGAEGGEEDFEADDVGGEEGADLGGEEIDFEEPSEEPEA